MDITAKNVLCIVQDRTAVICKDDLHICTAFADQVFIIFNIVDTGESVLFVAK